MGVFYYDVGAEGYQEGLDVEDDDDELKLVGDDKESWPEFWK